MPNMRDLSMATINLYNLQIPGRITYDTGKPPIPDTAEGRGKYEARLDWLARAIERIDADIICFQELWSAQALADVFDRVESVGDYDQIARDAPGRGKPQVALAVRRDRKSGKSLVENSEWIESFPDTFALNGIREKHGAGEEISVSIDKFSRPILRVEIQPRKTRPKPPAVTVFGCHLKSKRPATLAEVKRGSETVLDHHYAHAASAVSHTRRILEAAALRVLLDEHMTGIDSEDLSPTIVLGDLNDGTHSISTELITGQPSYRLVRKSTAGASADKGLYTVETLQQYRSMRHVYYTYIYRNKRQSLDHILVSEEFYDHSRKRHWSFRELDVYNDHINAGDRARIKESGGVDHGIVRAYFDWNPMEEEIEKIARAMS